MDNISNQELIREFEFDIPESKKIKIKNFSGDIKVYGADSSTIKVKAKIDQSEWFIDKGVDVDINVNTEENGTISLITKLNKGQHDKKFDWDDFLGSLFNFIGRMASRFAVSVNYEVWIPSGMRIICDNDNGKYDFRNFDGEALLKTSNGKISLEDVKGKFDVLTYNGAIKAERLEGEIKADTYNGKISITDSLLSEIFAQTKNGKITAHYKHYGAIGKSSLKSMSGKIVLSTNDLDGVRLESRTMNGVIADSYRGTMNKGENRFGPVSYGTQGEREIEIETMSGNILICDYYDILKNDVYSEEALNILIEDLKKKAVHKKFHNFKGFNNDSEEIKMVLEMVKDGKITSEEGERLIKAIKK